MQMNALRMYELIRAYADAWSELNAAPPWDGARQRRCAKEALAIAQELMASYPSCAPEHGAWLRVAADAGAILAQLPRASADDRLARDG